MCLEVAVDIMRKCKELSSKNLESLCFTTVKCHTYDVAAIYFVVAQLKSLLGTNPVSLCRFLMVCLLLYSLVVDKMSSSYVFPVGKWRETLCRCDGPLSVPSGRTS